MPVSRRRSELYGQVWNLAVPVCLVGLDDLVVRAVSKLAGDLIGLPPEQIVGHSASELTRPENWDAAQAALGDLRAGVIDFFRTARRLRSAGSGTGLTIAWVRRVDFGGESLALFEVSDRDPPPVGPLADYLGYEPAALAVGTLDRQWRITSISTDIGAVLGVEPSDVEGRLLLGSVQRDEVDLLLEAGRKAADEWSAGVRVHLRDSAGEWKVFCLVLTPLSSPQERLFVLVPEFEGATSERERVSRLEALLWHIAGEIEASGLLRQMSGGPDISGLPEVHSLSTRQWEVLRRLARGERVPTIAAELHLSPSTVRNHVSAILSRFGVSSQAQLLALLRDRDLLST